MAIIYRGSGIYTGLHTDTKPTTNIATNAMLLETDTGLVSQWNGTRWFVRNPTLPSSRKTGAYVCAVTTSVATVADGLCAAFGQAVTPNSLIDSDGRGLTYDTTAVQDTLAGLRVSTAISQRQWYLRMWTRFKLSATNDVRLWIGYRSAGAPTGDTTMNNNSGLIFGIYAANNTTGAGSTVGWQLAHNNGAASATTINTGTTADTNVHTIEIISDEANTRFGYSFDGAAYTYITSAIPSSSANLSPLVQIQNSTASSKVLSLYGVELAQDK